jgi:hypothetical protein
MYSGSESDANVYVVCNEAQLADPGWLARD